MMFFTSDYCAIQFHLAAHVAFKPKTPDAEQLRAAGIMHCEVWINAHAMQCGRQEMVVSENQYSGMVH